MFRLSSLRNVTNQNKYRIPLYRAGRDAYNRVFRPKVHAQRRRMRNFMSPFVQRGQLVFDIGANRGEYTEMFARMGARVIAVEPNSDLVGLIRARVPGAIVEQVAAGAEVGEGELWVGPQDGDSTLSPAYLDELRRTVALEMQSVPVQMTTLDALIERHGMPAFIKIDVEGFEAQVLAGLTSRPPALSFEFHGSLLGELQACLAQLIDYTFRISVGYEFEWATPWSDADEVRRHAERLAKGRSDLFADVYAVDRERSAGIHFV